MSSSCRSARRLSAILALCACKGASAPDPAPPAAGAVVPRDAGMAAALPVPAPVFEVPAPADAIVDLAETTIWACATRKSGHVDCWGDGDKLERLAEIDDATLVRGNEFYRCVVRRSEITCFSTGEEKKPPMHVPIAGAIEAYVGYPSCAVRADHSLACWDEETGKVQRKTKLRNVVSIDGNGYATCAVLADGKVSCASDTGDGHKWHRVALEHVRALAIGRGGADNGDYYSDGCAIHDDGSVQCFELSGHETGPIHVSAHGDLDVSGVRGATALAITGENELVVATAGSVITLRDGGAVKKLPKLADAVHVTPHCALRGQGSVVCWGDRNTGQPARSTAETPVPVVGVADAVSIACNERHGWAVTRDGHVFHWGEGDPGWAIRQAEAHDTASVVLGWSTIAQPCFLRRDGGVTCMSYRTEQPTDLKLAHVAELHADSELLARLGDDSLRYWMSSTVGEPGFELTEVPGIPNAVQVVGDLGHLCARDPGGRVVCEEPSCHFDHPPGHWSCAEGKWTPVAIPPARELAVARASTCALLATGEVSCWTSNTSPSPVVGLSKITALGGTEAGLCAVRADGSLVCWSEVEVREPKQVLAPGSVSGPFCGGGEGCTIRKDGLVACWGSNEYGRLGDGSILRLDSPAAVPGLQ